MMNKYYVGVKGKLIGFLNIRWTIIDLPLEKVPAEARRFLAQFDGKKVAAGVKVFVEVKEAR